MLTNFVAIQIISEIDNLMAATVTSDDSVGAMKLYVSKKRMRMTDIEIWKEFITFKDNN